MITKTDPLSDIEADVGNELACMAPPEGNTTDNGNGLDAILRPVNLLNSGSSMDEVTAALQMLVDASVNLDPLRRAVIRDKAIIKLGAIGIRSPAGVVSAAFSLIKLEQPEAGGQAMAFEDCQPWPDPVDGAKLLDDIVGVLKKYVVLPDKAAEAIALWIIHAWAFLAASISAILGIVSPEMKCGKTLLQILLGALVRRPLTSSNITAAALFRTVEAHQPTLLVDEADTFLGDRQELRGIVNSGHNKSGAYVIRTVGDDHTPVIFSTWCPKSIALIGNLPGTIEDRSIVIRMERKTAKERVDRLRSDRIFGDMLELRRKAARWAADHIKSLKTADPILPEELDDRAQDSWRLLIAIADAAGGEWGTIGRSAARTLSGIRTGSDPAIGALLLTDLQAIFAASQIDVISGKELIGRLQGLEDRPWNEYGKQRKPISQHQVARILKPYKIFSKQAWIGQENLRGYDRKDFNKAFSRYVPTLQSASTLEPLGNKGLDHFSKMLEDMGSSDQENGLKALSDKDSSDLASWKEGSGCEALPSDANEAENTGLAPPEPQPDQEPEDWMAGTRRFFAEKRRRDQAKGEVRR